MSISSMMKNLNKESVNAICSYEHANSESIHFSVLFSITKQRTNPASVAVLKVQKEKEASLRIVGQWDRYKK